MRDQSGSNSPGTTSDRGQSSTTSSSRLRGLESAKMRRGVTRGITSINNQRRNIRARRSDGVDSTPKLLSHSLYLPIEEGQLTAFDAIGTSQSGSVTQLAISSSLVRSSSVRTNVLPPSEETMESLRSPAQAGTGSQRGGVVDSDRAPSQFRLPRYDSSVLRAKPEKVRITVRETETFFIFEMAQSTEELDTKDGLAVKEANERYEYRSVGAGSNRKLTNAETQTPRVYAKSRWTRADRRERQNCGSFAKNWVRTRDAYADRSTSGERAAIPMESQEAFEKFSKSEDAGIDGSSSADRRLASIYEKRRFGEAARAMERIIASDRYVVAQKRFKDSIRKDPCSLDLEFTYDLDLLWTHSCSLVEGRAVSCFKWNPANENLLLAGYGASPFRNDGVLLVWSAKNPSRPDRIYRFESPVSDADWSKKKPNRLAIGFYDGTVKVIDASEKDSVSMRESRRETSPSYSPHWQVQWWSEDEELDCGERIYTANQDGRILCYRSEEEDFASTEIMRIPRIEGKMGGVRKRRDRAIRDTPMSENPGALLLRRHPSLGAVYLVATEEGCAHRCSTDYLDRRIESFVVHDGPVYSLEFSPFSSKIFLTCGADWCTRIWADGIREPLVTLSSEMSCVRGATWCPANSTVIASIARNVVSVWDIKRKIHGPVSIGALSTNGANGSIALEFTKNGNRLVVADLDGNIYIYSLEGMPFPPFDQTSLLLNSIEKALVARPKLLRKFKKIFLPL